MFILNSLPEDSFDFTGSNGHYLLMSNHDAYYRKIRNWHPRPILYDILHSKNEKKMSKNLTAITATALNGKSQQTIITAVNIKAFTNIHYLG